MPRINMEEKTMMDLVAVGELLIDFAPAGQTPRGTALFERNPGGAPANVLAMASILEKKTALIGKVGDDSFGRFLTEVMNNIHVDTKGLVYTKEANTTLAFVSLDPNGDRSFSFYRNPGADMLLAPSDVDAKMVGDCRIFHFGTVSMTDNPSREATFFAMKTAKENGVLLSFDPNLRPLLWKSMEEAKAMIEKGLPYADILKVSNEELLFITGTEDLDAGSQQLADRYGISAILVTLGPQGCYYRINGHTGILPAYDVRTIDTTGAGDAFLGAFLGRFLEFGKGISMLDRQEIENLIDFANAAGSLATTKKGAIPSMPSRQEITDCQKNVPKLLSK